MGKNTVGKNKVPVVYITIEKGIVSNILSSTPLDLEVCVVDFDNELPKMEDKHIVNRVYYPVENNAKLVKDLEELPEEFDEKTVEYLATVKYLGYLES